jgi:hypothetical protein
MRIPAQSDENETVYRSVLQEVYRVGEQGDGADRQRDAELDAEIGEIEQRNNAYGPAAALRRPCLAALDAYLWLPFAFTREF